MTLNRLRLNPVTLHVDVTGIAIAVAMTVACAGALVWPIFARSSEVHTPNALTDLENRARAEETALRLDRASLEKLQAEALKTVRLEPVTRVNERLVGLAALADKCGVTITLLTPQKPQPAAKATIVPVKLAGNASYAAITRFVHALHAEYRDTAVVGLSIVGSPTQKPQDAAYTLDLAWYAAPAVSNDAKSTTNRNVP